MSVVCDVLCRSIRGAVAALRVPPWHRPNGGLDQRGRVVWVAHDVDLETMFGVFYGRDAGTRWGQHKGGHHHQGSEHCVGIVAVDHQTTMAGFPTPGLHHSIGPGTFLDDACCVLLLLYRLVPIKRLDVLGSALGVDLIPQGYFF